MAAVDDIGRSRSGKRVAFYCPTPDIPHGGGAERVMVMLAGAVAAAGHRVDFAFNRFGPCWQSLDPSVRRVALGSSRRGALLPLVRHVREQRPEVLFSTCFSGNVMALLAHLSTGRSARAVVRLESCFSRYLESPSLRTRLLARVLAGLLPAADAVIAQCDAMAQDLAERVPQVADRIVSVRNPVDVAAIREMSRMDPAHPWLDRPRAEPTVLAVSRLIPVKDIPTLLRAVAELNRVRRVRLVVLGEGPDRDALLELRRELDLSDRVDFVGRVPNPYAYMARADVVAHSSRYEGLGNSLVEAMACGTPVASTDYRVGAREILQCGRLGPLAPVGDHPALARAIGEALASPVDPALLRRAAQRHDLPVSIAEHLRVLGLE